MTREDRQPVPERTAPARRGRPALDALERVPVETRAAWRAWLAAHHATSPGVWVVTWKQGSGRPRLAYDDIVEEALCFGWIDSLPRKLDADRTMLLVTPRKPGSPWSRLNKARVARLMQAGLMTPAGLAKVEAAKRDGSWTRLDAVEALEVPPDLARALDAHRDAARNFAAFPPSAKKGILQWIASAKRPETRARRVAETARRAARNERANQ